MTEAGTGQQEAETGWLLDDDDDGDDNDVGDGHLILYTTSFLVTALVPRKFATSYFFRVLQICMH
jgi:hypothetical protein